MFESTSIVIVYEASVRLMNAFAYDVAITPTYCAVIESLMLRKKVALYVSITD